MPELPEVEIVKQSLIKKIKGKIIQKVLVKNRNLRFKLPNNFEKKITKKKVLEIKRFSKYIILKFEDNSGFIIHLVAHLGGIRAKMNNFDDYNVPSLGDCDFTIFLNCY